MKIFKSVLINFLITTLTKEKEFIEAVSEVYNNYEFYSNNSLKLGKYMILKKVRNKWQNLMKDLEKDKK